MYWAPLGLAPITLETGKQLQFKNQTTLGFFFFNYKMKGKMVTHDGWMATYSLSKDGWL